MVPTIPLVGYEEEWGRIADAIEHNIMPRLDADGEAFFVTSEKVLSTFRAKEALQAAKHHRFPMLEKHTIAHMFFLLRGQSFIAIGERCEALKAPAGIFVPKGIPFNLHMKVTEQIPSSWWIVCTVTDFGAIVTQCRLTPQAHFEGKPHLIVVTEQKPAKLVPFLDLGLMEARERPYSCNTPQFVFLLSGGGWIYVRGNWYHLKERQGIFVPKDCLFFPHGMAGDTFPEGCWLWFAIHTFGAAVHQCQLAQNAHYHSPIYAVVDERIFWLFQEWETEAITRGNPTSLISKSLLLAMLAITLPSIHGLPT